MPARASSDATAHLLRKVDAPSMPCRSSTSKGVDNASEVSGDPTNMGGSTLSIYANGSGHEGSVLKGSANTNGQPKDAADMAVLAESGCGKLDGIGVVVRFTNRSPK